MTFNISKKNKILTLTKNEQNKNEIYNLYNEKDFYKVSYGDLEVENFKYKYPVKFIMQKFEIENIQQLLYLVSLCSEKIGTCQFCNEDIYRYNTRSSINQLTCKCIANCNKCNKAGAEGYIQKGLCMSCTPYENIEPSTSDYYRDHYSTEEIYNGCLFDWTAKDILEEIDIEKLNTIIEYAVSRIKFLKKLGKILK
jgi:hypothetical protein